MTYDFILWSCHHRNHCFVLGERIERALYDLLETLIRAKYTKERRELLEYANLVLEILRFENVRSASRNNNVPTNRNNNGFRPASTLPAGIRRVKPKARTPCQANSS